MVMLMIRWYDEEDFSLHFSPSLFLGFLFSLLLSIIFFSSVTHTHTAVTQHSYPVFSLQGRTQNCVWTISATFAAVEDNCCCCCCYFSGQTRSDDMSAGRKVQHENIFKRKKWRNFESENPFIFYPRPKLRCSSFPNSHVFRYLWRAHWKKIFAAFFVSLFCLRSFWFLFLLFYLVLVSSFWIKVFC